MKWYQQYFFNKRDWLLCNYKQLGLSEAECLLCLLIEFAKEKNIKIDYHFFEKYFNDRQETDKVLNSLVSKAYLHIDISGDDIKYELDNIYEEKNTPVSDNLFDLFEQVFARPLNATEYEKLAKMCLHYSDEDIKKALRMADAYNEHKMNYVEAILKKNHEEE